MISPEETSRKIKLISSEKSLNYASGEKEMLLKTLSESSRRSISFINQNEASKTGIDKIIVISEKDDDEKVFDENLDMITLIKERINEFGYSPRKILLDDESTWPKKIPSSPNNAKTNLRCNKY